MVINVTKDFDAVTAENVDDDELKPYGVPNQYYVAAVVQRGDYDANVPYILGDGSNTTFDGIRYTNAPIRLGTYRYFVRAYTIGPVSQLFNVLKMLTNNFCHIATIRK